MTAVVWSVDRPRTVQGGDLLTGPRVTSFRWEVLDQDDAQTGVDLDGRDRVIGGYRIGGGATGGRIDYSRDAEIRSSGVLEWAGLTPCDWLDFRLKPWITLTFPTGDRIEWPLGVFLPSTPATRWDGTGAGASVDLYDKLVILRDDSTPVTFALPAGAVVTDEIRTLIAGTGETAIAITDSTATLRLPRVWEPGTSKLRIINDLLKSINYWSIWVDGHGQFRADPYRPGSDRTLPPAHERYWVVSRPPRGEGALQVEEPPVTVDMVPAWDFRDDETSIYRPEFDHEEDGFDVPNVVTLVTNATGDEPALSVSLADVDEGSRWSIQRRGRQIDLHESGVDASDLWTLNEMVKRRMAEAQQVGSVVTIDHAPIPLELNTMVTFEREPAGLALNGVVQAMTITCDPTALMRTRIRQVAS